MGLTKFQALFIKYLRVRHHGTWRWVAGKWDERYNKKIPFNEESTFGGNQITGMELCDAAMDYLNETIQDGWN